MGKGNRSRTLHATEIIENSAPKKSADKSTTITWIIVALVALLIAASILLNAANTNGWVLKSKVAVKSNNFKVTGTMLSYFVYAYYQQYYYSYASYFGITTGTALDQQYYDEDNDITWFDYFANALSSQLAQSLSLCEEAKARGITLDSTETSNIDSQIDEIKSAAKTNGYTTSTYLSLMFGNGVTESDVRTAMEISTLASKCYNELYDEEKAKLTESDVQGYFEANPSKFLSADTLQYTFKATMTTADAEATEAETAQYTADKENMLAKANALKAAATSEDAFKQWILDDLTNADSAKALFDTNFATASSVIAEENLPSDEVKTEALTKILDYIKASAVNPDTSAPDWGNAVYSSAFNAVCSNMYSSIITSTYNTLAVDDVTYEEPNAETASDTAKFLFAAERAVGDVEVITAEGETESTYTVIFVTKTAAADDTPTRSVAHILLTGAVYGYDDEETQDPASTAAQTKASEVLNEYLDTDRTLDDFLAIGEKYTEDSSVEYDDVVEGDMATEFNDWLFSSERYEGNVDIIKTDYGYHVMYYIGEGVATWYAQARTSLTSEKMTEMYDTLAEKYNVTINDKVVKTVE